MLYARNVYEQINDLYVARYGHPSVANNFEVHAILGVSQDGTKITSMMHDRRGQPCVRYEMAFANLPRIKEDETVQGKPLKMWDKFSLEIRGEALKRLGERGIYVWQASFDQHSREVRALCQSIEDGTVLIVKPEKAMYTFSGVQENNPRSRFDFGAFPF